MSAPQKAPVVAFILVALAVVTVLAVSAYRWDLTARDYLRRAEPLAPSSRPDTDAARGIFLDNDAYYWVHYAQEMSDSRTWRIRHTETDNPPNGRELHWSQSVSWLLNVTGFLRHLFTDESLHVAIERGAVWLNPAIHIIFTLLTGWFLFRSAGLVPSVVWTLGILTIPSIQWTFHPLRPDHHGLHLAFTVSSTLSLILGGLGWVKTPHTAAPIPKGVFRSIAPPDKQKAGMAFIVSGALGGLGVWTGASVQLLGIGVITVGAVLFIMQMPASTSTADHDPYAPVLWRCWAITGVATSAIFYLIEYAPHFPGMRLEVNHPLHWFSWLCAGELLARMSAAKAGGKPLRAPAIAALGVGAMVVPALLVAGPSEWHAMKDPLMLRMHRFIDEFRTYRDACGGLFTLDTVSNLGVLPLFLLMAPVIAGARRTTTYEWAALLFSFSVALAYTALMLLQVRWINFCAAGIMFPAVTTLSVLGRRDSESCRLRLGVWALLAALFIQTCLYLRQQLGDTAFRDISREQVPEFIVPILQRQLSQNLAAADTNGSLRVMGGPHMAARLMYYGQIPSVASYYWENLDGLRATTSFFAAEDNDDALRIASERGITHVIIPPSADFARMFYFIKHGHVSDIGARNSMAGRLLDPDGPLPGWIRRDANFGSALQPGYLFAGKPIKGSLLVFRINLRKAGP